MSQLNLYSIAKCEDKELKQIGEFICDNASDLARALKFPIFIPHEELKGLVKTRKLDSEWAHEHDPDIEHTWFFTDCKFLLPDGEKQPKDIIKISLMHFRRYAIKVHKKDFIEC